MNGLSVAVNIPDCHIPWQSKAAFNITLRIIKDVHDTYGLDEVNILGDFLDFFHVTLHPKMPSHFNIKQTFKDEIYIGNQCIDQIDEITSRAKKKRFIEGNHEYRLVRYLTKNAPALFDMVTVPELLKLEKRNWDFIPFGKKQLVSCMDSDYHLRHQPYSGSKHCAASTVDKKYTSLGFGHTHRRQTYTTTDALGKEFIGRSLGWLGDRLAAPFDYMDTDTWAMSFEVVFKHEGMLHPVMVDIKYNIETQSYQALFDGKLYIEEGTNPYDGCLQ